MKVFLSGYRGWAMTRSARVLMVLMVILVLFLLGTSRYVRSASGDRVTLTKALWEQNNDQLVIEGTSDPNGTVFVTDARSGAVLVATTANGSGIWAEQLSGLTTVPCRVSAASGGGVVEMDITAAPVNCGPSPLAYTEARWDGALERLIVRGSGDAFRFIVVTDADSGVDLATVRSDEMGTWTAEIDGLSPVSCRISAESNIDAPLETAVADAPTDCGPPQMGAKYYAENLCYLCHGDNGSGNDLGPDIRGGSEPKDIREAIAEEMVMSGIELTDGEIEAISVFLNNPRPLPALAQVDYENPTQCRICHVRQYREWSGNMMAYSAFSPTFTALESLGSAFSAANGGHGFAAGTHDTALFCEGCHNPVSTAMGEFPTLAQSNGRPLRDFAGEVGIRGISCEVCHQVSHPDTGLGLGRLGDGIANAAFILQPGTMNFGPLVNPQPNPIHDSAFATDINGDDGYLGSSEFCGTCHDVRTPPDADMGVDPETGEPFQRLENLFTEWRNGPYGPENNGAGGVVSCQDCHMDAGPPAPAGTYYGDITSIFSLNGEGGDEDNGDEDNGDEEDGDEDDGDEENGDEDDGDEGGGGDDGIMRERVSTHYFTGVDIALVDFPGQDDASLDEHGNVIGQVQRREALLQSAAVMSITTDQNSVAPGDTLSVMVNVTNVGAGHNIPSGFSQERQMWIEFTVTAANGDIIYQSGHLVDSIHPETGELVPDGNLDDEDLQNFVGTIDPVTLEANVVHGPDFNGRHEDPPIYRGLANFGNEFIRFIFDGNGVIIGEEEVFMPFLSDHTDNSHSIPPLETEHVRYDVEIPGNVTGPLQITARLRFRAFPPRFLRALAVGRPDLVNETIVDRNRIVEMTTADPVIIMVNGN